MDCDTPRHIHMQREKGVNSSEFCGLDAIQEVEEGHGFNCSPLGQTKYYHNIWY